MGKVKKTKKQTNKRKNTQKNDYATLHRFQNLFISCYCDSKLKNLTYIMLELREKSFHLILDSFGKVIFGVSLYPCIEQARYYN